jgi:hypothetical protein
MDPGGPRALLAVLGLGAAVRLLLLLDPAFWYDEATTGLTGLAVLRGEWPVYFFGQPFMGALDGYLAAPLYAAFGPSVLTLKLVPVLVSILWMGLVVRLAREGFGARAALYTALLLALPPDFLLRWAHEARAHYTLAMALGALALLLALRAPAAPAGRRALGFGLTGLVLGLAFWTNFLSVVYGPAAGVLLARRGLRPLVRGLAPALLGFLAGSLPHWLYGIPHGTAIPTSGPPVGGADVVEHLRALARVAWPIVAGVPPGVRGAAVGWLVAGALALLAVAAAARATLRRPPGPLPGRAVGLALVAVAAVNVGLGAGTAFGRGFEDRDPRYLLPLYTALPPVIGAWLAGCPAWLGRALATGLLVVQVAGAATGSLRVLRPEAAEERRRQRAAPLETLAALERRGFDRLYDARPGTRGLTFLSGERVIVSNHYEEILPRHALAVDGAERVAWWSAGPSARLEAGFAALGLRSRYHAAGPLGGVYADFRLREAWPLRELAARDLRVTASDSPGAAGSVIDRDLATLWATAGLQQGGEWLQVDLGAPVRLALVRWLPGSYQEIPAGVRLDGSGDGRTWRTLLDVPDYRGPLYWSAGRPLGRVRGGRVELRLAPEPIRHLRIVQTGRSTRFAWTVRELFLYEAVEAGHPAPSALAGDRLAAGLRVAGVRWLYADHGWAARAALADPALRVLPANLLLDPYGFEGPAVALAPAFDWRAGAGVLLEAVDAPRFADTLAAAGLRAVERPLADLRLFTPDPVGTGAVVPREDLRLTASRHPGRARRAADGNPQTRWATHEPRRAGDWIEIRLAAPRRVEGLRLWTSTPTDSPGGVRVEGSADGRTWATLPGEVRHLGRLRWHGFGALRAGVDTVRVDLAPAVLRALRITLIDGDPTFDWSIHELAVLAAD